MQLGTVTMSDYMVVATFKLGTDMTQVMALV
jgi:hypothetical protein